MVGPYLWASFFPGRTPDITSKVYGIIDPQDADLNRLREWQDAGMLEAEAKVVWSWPDPDRPKLIIREVTKNDWEVSRQH